VREWTIREFGRDPHSVRQRPSHRDH
jgi:hypothetical protein